LKEIFFWGEKEIGEKARKMSSTTLHSNPKMRAGTYRLFHVDKTLSGYYFISYVHESAHAANIERIIYVEDVRRLATRKGIPLIIITYTAPDNIPNGWNPEPSRRPEGAEYMRKKTYKNIRPYLFFMPPLSGEIIVPYTMDGVNKRLDAIHKFREMVPDDLREIIGEYLGVRHLTTKIKHVY
jgi:hypothetical protein